MLTEALEALQAANQAKADFLAAVDGDDDPETSLTEAEVNDLVDAAIAGIDALVDGYQDTNSSAVRAALVADEQARLEENLAEAEEDLADAQAEIAKVAGLNAAVSNLQAAKATLESAEEAQEVSSESVEIKLAVVNATNNGLTGYDYEAPAANAADVVVVSNGDDVSLISINAQGVVVVDAAGKNQDGTLKAGVADLLAAVQADFVAIKAVASAAAAVEAAEAVVTNLDLTDEAVAALVAVGAEMGLAIGAKPSQAQIETEIARLQAVLQTEEGLVAITAAEVVDAGATLAEAEEAWADLETARGELATAAGNLSDAEELLEEVESDLEYFEDLVTSYNNALNAYDPEDSVTGEALENAYAALKETLIYSRSPGRSVTALRLR